MGEKVIKMKYDFEILKNISSNNGSCVELDDIFDCKWGLKNEVSVYGRGVQLNIYLNEKVDDNELNVSSKLVWGYKIANYSLCLKSKPIVMHAGTFQLKNYNEHTRFDLILRFEKTTYNLKCLDEVFELPFVSMIPDIPPITSTFLIIKCKDGRGVEVSKLKISERSAYFCSMFLPDGLGSIRENKTTRIFDVSDNPLNFSYNSICAMVLFLYTGKVDIWSMQLARELICLANEYVIIGLREAVEDYLMRNLILDAVEIFKLAHIHKLKIKEKVMLFIGCNLTYLDTLDEMRKFEEEEPVKFNDILKLKNRRRYE